MDGIDKFFQQSNYNVVRFLMRFSGLWPFHSTAKRCAIYFTFLLVLGSGVMFEVLGVIGILSDIFAVLECLPLLFLALSSLIKVICMAFTLPKIKILLIKIRDHWDSPKTDEEAKIMGSHALSARKFGYMYAVVLLGHCAMYMFTALLSRFVYLGLKKDEDKSNDIPAGIPTRVNYFIDQNTYYYPIFIHMTVCELSHIVFIVMADVLYMTLIQHCCGLLAALRYRLENAFKEDDVDGLVRTLTENRSYSNVVYSIRRHAEAIQFGSIIESVYRLPLLLHIGYNISIISIVGFQAISNTNHILRHVIYFSGIVLNAFIENWQGQKIIDESEAVYESAYNAQWYDMPIATKKLLIMIMMKSIKPVQMTAGKIIVMSYMNFNAVLRIASSYFMLLRSMQ